jgi:hypothetical protein
MADVSARREAAESEVSKAVQALRVASQGANTSILLALAPRALAEDLLRQIEERRRRQDAPKIYRIRPGDPPRVRMPSIEKPPGA